MAGPGADPIGEEGPRYYCVNHPNTETLIRCSKCLDPICQKCAVPTPVGLRCRKCAYANRSPLYVIKPQHVLLAAVVGLAMALVVGIMVAQIGVLWVALLAGPVGGAIAEVLLRVTRGKRGRVMQVTAVLCIVVGALLGPRIWAAILAGSLAAAWPSWLAILATLLDLRVLAWIGLGSVAAVVRLR